MRAEPGPGRWSSSLAMQEHGRNRHVELLALNVRNGHREHQLVACKEKDRQISSTSFDSWRHPLRSRRD